MAPKFPTQFATVEDVPAVRVTMGNEEIRNLLNRGITQSKSYSGDVFVSRLGQPEMGYMTSPKMVTSQAPFKAGYAFYANPERVVDPNPMRVTFPHASAIEKSLFLTDPSYPEAVRRSYTSQGFGVFEGGMPASEVREVRKIYGNPVTKEYSLGRARPFDVLQQKYEGISSARKARTAFEMGRDLRPAARTLGRALGTEAASVGGMALRGLGRLAGPVGVAMTAYDLAQAFPAPEPISEEDMSRAMREYRTGPQPQFAR
jgi:hypothetical protein